MCLSLLFCAVEAVINVNSSFLHAATHSNAVHSSVKPMLPCNLGILLYQAMQLLSKGVTCCSLHSIMTGSETAQPA